ncbi:glycoside hydrolase family 18 protein [Plenodomus tracheiphilus IPT5]|uniref:chitinase n=1 Tax=Plenodomus tracheiphilus IPT5 TaxID=1408161 RepID=A0A6A7B6U7_9PLEO|nr:glycoside hydrolase family 18 protein [Plenodomus tracheiphilus IPT5]
MRTPFSLLPLGLQFLRLAAAASNGTNSTLLSERGNGSALYLPLFERHSNSTPIFINSTGETANPLIKALQDKNNKIGKRSFHLPIKAKRDDWVLPEGTCAPGTPCVNGACCSKTGVCGYAPTECGTGNCISNCNATAPCGQYAKPEEKQCPLNVCCSSFGFCGSTDQFCTTEGPRQCQKGYGSCGAAPRPSCNGGDSTSQRVVGYYEGWSRQPEDIDLTAFTHLNFAFAFFDPKTFQMTPMNPGDVELYRRFTALKSKKPSLRTWIAVGGWSFNDATNIPNTRTAFSDMVSTSANRKAFIASIGSFLRTYNFDGVDLDWEYPAADDRGGNKADKVNFVTFLQELRSAFGTRYGISLTLPASFWYLQGFDVKAIQQYVDWMNVMSYDIHGVWDSGNKHTGPYIRPHTNLTEIDEGLDLLWRAGVDSSKVVLGLGWYGRSFTLSSPACNVPNGECTFAEGGKPGECTASAGTLTNAEINRIIAKGGVTKGYDRQAAVKWITWDSNQWVSYDDGETTQLKINFANNRCLAGKMIWAVDQDDVKSSSTNDLLGIGPANGVSADKAQRIKDDLNNATQAAAVASSCYWTFCGDTCTPGYFAATDATGQIAGIQRDTECSKDRPQTLCCAPGTSMGQCKWEGWRGFGLSCAPVCSDTSATIVARNSNSGEYDCNGGYQAYCCTGFVPSSKTNTGSLALVGQGGLAKRGVRGGVTGGILGALACVAAVSAVNLALAFFTAGLSIIGGAGAVAACGGIGAVLGFIASGLGKMLQAWPKLFGPTVPKNIGTPNSNGKKYGQWDLLDFGALQSSTSSRCDCTVTYTCRYGLGWDEICDNQRWGIDQALHRNTVYHYKASTNANLYNKYSWAHSQRHEGFRTLAQQSINRVARCQVDEFPMGALREAQGTANPQVVRLVNGPANGAQGRDFRMWKLAVWTPCKLYRQHVCGLPAALAEPPITWAFDRMDQGRRNARTDGNHFIKAYGFDSQTPGSECWATHTYNQLPQGFLATNTISDHGFRALNDDPMFSVYNWDWQLWRTSPATPFPQDVASANYLKRQEVQSVLRNEMPYDHDDQYDRAEDCLLIDDNEGGMECLPYHYMSDAHYGLHEQRGEYHHHHHQYHAPPPVTSTTTQALPAVSTEYTEARTGLQSPGPLQTATAEG